LVQVEVIPRASYLATLYALLRLAIQIFLFSDVMRSEAVVYRLDPDDIAGFLRNIIVELNRFSLRPV